MKRNGKPSMSNLFPEDSSGDEETSANHVPLSKKNRQDNGNPGGFGINKGYAERYDSWRNKEELMKMKARYGTDNLEKLEEDSDDESSSSEEDDWTPEQEKEFFKTLANLKKKDPKIYDPEIKFFSKGVENVAGSSGAAKNDHDGTEGAPAKKKKKDKPFLLKDHERTMILEKGGLLSDEEEEEDKDPKHVPISYYEELANIKKEFSTSLKEIESDDEDGLIRSSDNKLLMKKKIKTEAETAKEDEEYRLWLKGELERLEKGQLSKDEEKELGFLRSYWTNEKLDDGEKFLRDYILNRKYIEPEDDTKTVIPEYNSVAHDSDEGGLSNDEAFESHREEFEHKYNFRFEEPDPEFIKRFPRTIQDSLRRENEKRKKERESAKERKQEAKERKKEEVQRLKAAKRKEIVDKMRQLQDISGNPDLPVNDLDLEGDFDPLEYDRKMQKVFNEQYYNKDAQDEAKPEFPFDPEIDDEVNWEEWVPTEDEDTEESQNELEESAQTEDTTKKKRKIKSGRNAAEEKQRLKRKESAIEELIEASKGKRATCGKKKSVFLEVLEKKKPKFDPKLHKSFEKYFEEYYALDFEDLVGDLPCRFKYRKVVANDFGLSVNEILKAPDKELNKWASLKKTYQYRAEDEEKYEAQAYQKKAENENLKKKVLLSLYNPIDKDNESDQNAENEEVGVAQLNIENPDKKSKKKKKKKKKHAPDDECIAVEQDNAEHLNDQITDNNEEPNLDIPLKKKKKKKSSYDETNNNTMGSLDQVTKDTDLQNRENSRKSKKKKSVSDPSVEASENDHVNSSEVSKKKKKSFSEPSVESKDHNQGNSSEVSKKKKKKSFDRNTHKQAGGVKRRAEADIGIEDDRLKAYGLNPKKYKKWMKYGGASKNKQ